jgi:hypothetical protein
MIKDIKTWAENVKLANLEPKGEYVLSSFRLRGPPAVAVVTVTHDLTF